MYCFGPSSELAEGGSLYDLLYVNNSEPVQTKRLQWTKEIAEGTFILSITKIHESTTLIFLY